MKGIDVEDILTFHRKIIEQTGGSDGIRYIGLIESALNRAFTTFDSNDLYKDIEDKISVITYGLVKNHGFVDGNKRMGVSVMLLLLRLNGMIMGKPNQGVKPGVFTSLFKGSEGKQLVSPLKGER